MGILDKMNDDNMVASPMSWWSGWADTAVDQNLILEFGSSYCADAMNAYTYFNSTYSSLTKYGFVGFAGDYGGDGHTGLAHMLDKDGLASPWTYLPSTWEFNVTTAIEGIVANQLEVVMLATGPTQTAEIVGGVAQASLSPKWIALAPAYNDAFVAPDFALKDLMESSMYVTAWGAPYSYDSIGHAKMRAALTASGVDSTNSFLLAGWMSQYSLESALRALVSSGDAMTRANLRQIVTSLQVSSDNMLMPYQLNSPSSSSVIGKPDGSAAGGVQLLEFVSTDESVADVCFG